MNSPDETHTAPMGITLKVRLTLWYGIALGVILAIFAGTLYMVLARGLKDQVDRSLEEAATVAVKALEERRVGPFVRFHDLLDIKLMKAKLLLNPDAQLVHERPDLGIDDRQAERFQQRQRLILVGLVR